MVGQKLQGTIRLTRALFKAIYLRPLHELIRALLISSNVSWWSNCQTSRGRVLWPTGKVRGLDHFVLV